MKTFRPLSPPSLSTRFTSPGITPSIGNSSDDDATEELIRSQVRRIKQRSARRSHPHRSVFLDSSSGSSDESAQDLTRSQANHVEQIDISPMRNMQMEESSVKAQNARNRCQDDSPKRKDAPMVLENIEDTPQLWLKKAENDLLSCSLFGNREHESKPAKKMVFEKVTTLEDQVRALQQRIDNQDKNLENIKRETERRLYTAHKAIADLTKLSELGKDFSGKLLELERKIDLIDRLACEALRSQANEVKLKELQRAVEVGISSFPPALVEVPSDQNKEAEEGDASVFGLTGVMPGAGKREDRMESISSDPGEDVTKLTDGSVGLSLVVSTGKKVMHGLEPGGPASKSNEVCVGDGGEAGQAKRQGQEKAKAEAASRAKAQAAAQGKADAQAKANAQEEQKAKEEAADGRKDACKVLERGDVVRSRDTIGRIVIEDDKICGTTVAGVSNESNTAAFIETSTRQMKQLFRSEELNAGGNFAEQDGVIQSSPQSSGKHGSRRSYDSADTAADEAIELLDEAVTLQTQHSAHAIIDATEPTLRLQEKAADSVDETKRVRQRESERETCGRSMHNEVADSVEETKRVETEKQHRGAEESGGGGQRGSGAFERGKKKRGSSEWTSGGVFGDLFGSVTSAVANQAKELEAAFGGESQTPAARIYCHHRKIWIYKQP